MLTTDFLYLLSFLLFLGCVLKFGKHHILSFFKEGIQAIQNAINTASERQDKALEDLNKIRIALHEFQKSADSRAEVLQEKVNYILYQHSETMNQLIQTRERDAFERMAHDRIIKVRAFKSQILDEVLQEVLKRLEEHPDQIQKLNQASFDLLKKQLTQPAQHSS